MVPEVNFFLKSLDEMLSLFDALSPYENHRDPAYSTEIYHLQISD